MGDVYINSGNGFVSNANWRIPTFDIQHGISKFVDINADGLIDVVSSYPTETYVYLNPGVEVQGDLNNTTAASGPADMLYSVDNGVGITSSIEYTSSLHATSSFLPFSFPIVKSVTTIAGIRMTFPHSVDG